MNAYQKESFRSTTIDDIITHGDLGKWQGCCELSAEEIIRALKKLYGQKSTMVQLAELTCIAYPTRKGRSSVASSFCYQLHSGYPLRKGVVTIDAPNFINGLGLYFPALPAALGARQFVEGPAVCFLVSADFMVLLSLSQASQDCSTRIFETGGWMLSRRTAKYISLKRSTDTVPRSNARWSPRAIISNRGR